MSEPGSLFAGAPEGSRRRRTRFRALVYRLAAPLIDLAVRALWRSCRAVDVEDDGGAWSEVLRAEHPCVPCFWHEHLVLCIGRLQRAPDRGTPLAYLVSPSIDGDLFELVLHRWDARVVRGSSTRTGLRAMRGLYRVVAKEGVSPVITPDGPVGPAREAKLGALMLSQLARAPVLPMSVACRRAWRAPSWDRLVVPWPFTRVAFALGRPIRVPRDADEDALEAARVELEQSLAALESRARARLAGPGSA